MTAVQAPTRPWQGRSLLVIGGARSGKSRIAQAAAEASGLLPVFVATAEAFDAEMADRIARHRADRDARWTTVEAPRSLAAAIRAEERADRVLLVDCLTVWTSNLMLADLDVEAATDALVAAIAAAPGRVVLVSNEVGWGIVPDNALARRFRDVAGRVNQCVAAAVDEAWLVVAGRVLALG